MKITIERGKRKWQVVPCGRKCSYKKRGIDCNGDRDYCVNGCRVPKWWIKFLNESSGLMEVGK